MNAMKNAKDTSKRLLAATACAAALSAAAAAETPMWVIRDADSTIYLTGTVHMLPPELEWSGDKLDKALEDATELWLEVPMAGSLAEMQAEIAPIMMQYALSPNKPLSSRLTEEEQAQLAAALERADLPPGLCMMRARDGRLSFYCRSSEERGIWAIFSV